MSAKNNKKNLMTSKASTDKILSLPGAEHFLASNRIVIDSHQKITKCPLPEPEILEKYNGINPEIVPLLLKMLEKEQQMAALRQEEEFKIKAKAINSVNLGRVIGFLCFCGLVALAAWSLFLNNSMIVNFLVSGLSVIVVLATATIGFSIYRKKEDGKNK